MSVFNPSWKRLFLSAGILALFFWTATGETSVGQTYSLSQIWFDSNLFSSSVIQTGGYNRALAYSLPANQLFVANRNGSLAGISILNPGDGTVIGSVAGAGSIQPDQILAGGDGVLYAIPLDTSLSSSNFRIYSWTNVNAAPYSCYNPTGSDGTSQSLITGYRAGDTAAITGAGSNTVILCGINSGVATTNCVFLFSTTDGLNFSATLLCLTNLPKTYSDLGPAHGYSFYTNGTFVFKPGGASSYLIRYPANFASLGNPVYVGAIATNSLSGNSVVTDFAPAGGLLATLQLPQSAGNTSTLSLYGLASFTGLNLISTASTVATNANGNDTGGIALGGTGKTNSLFTLDSNNGLYGWSLSTNTVVETGTATPSQLQTNLAAASNGAVEGLSTLDPLSCPALAMTQTFTGGKLIFSDSPESPTAPALLYVDTNLPATGAAGPNRIFAYHVNADTAEEMKFSVLIENTGAAPATLTVVHSGVAGPSANYAYTGEVAFYRWLTNTQTTTVTVAPGQTVRLDTNFDSILVNHNYLLNGIWDYTCTQPHAVFICALNPGDDPVAVGPSLPVAARDTHVRGTFANCNKSYVTTAGTVVDTAAGVKECPIAGDGDAIVMGFDNAVSPPTAETDSGNYGVLYNIQIDASSRDGRALALVINPRGGGWSGAVETAPGILPGGAFLIPTGGAVVSSATNAAVMGEYFANAGEVIPLQFMPTGGSSFPVLLLTVPFASAAPDLSTISNYTVNPGQTVAFTASATGGTPPLTYTLPLAPANAVIGASSGFFTWRAPVSSAGSTVPLEISVIDSSAVPLSDSQDFTITVNPLSPVTLAGPTLMGGIFSFQVNGSIGPDYILQAATNLASPIYWSNILTNTPGVSPFYLVDTNAAGFANRFYRVLLGP